MVHECSPELLPITFRPYLRGVKFKQAAGAEDHDFVVVHDCVEAMSYCDDSAPLQAQASQNMNGICRHLGATCADLGYHHAVCARALFSACVSLSVLVTLWLLVCVRDF